MKRARMVTLYGPKGEPVIEPTLLDLARASEPSSMLPIVESLSKLNPFADRPVLVSRLVDHRGQPIFSEVQR